MASNGLVLRPLEGPRDDTAIRRLFRDTVALGLPVPFAIPGLARYEAICLDWYLGPGRANAAVVETDGRVEGYVLVCTDEASHARFLRREAPRWTAWAIGQLARRRLDHAAATFVRLRLADGWTSWRHTPPPPMPAHIHVNLSPAVKGSRAGLEVLRHADAAVRSAGHQGWFGEVNAPVGRRAAALTRLVGDVVHRQPNRTLSWLAQQPVERLTIVRDIARTTHTVQKPPKRPSRSFEKTYAAETQRSNS